jgi:thioredoxin-related protein
MKILLIALFSSFLTTSSLWLSNIDQAKKEASDSHKNILVNFSGSDWCGPCIRMHKEIFESDAFAKYAGDNLVLLNADFPRLKKNQLSKDQTKLNEALADKYNPGGKFPYTVLLDANGKVLKSWEGYTSISPETFITEVNSAAHGAR